MLDYKGQRCFSCGEEFKEGDDVVVCPECGTPYHRECYIKEGKCINTSLHEEGKIWSPDVEADEEIRCPRCGGLNKSDFEYCSHCGAALKQDETERPFNEQQNTGYGGYGNNGGGYQNRGGGFYGQGGFGPTPFGGGMFGQSTDPFDYFCRSYGVDPSERVEGIGIKEYYKYVRGNAMYFIMKFLRFSKEGIKRSINFPALLFPHVYFFFRKMYVQAITYLTISIATSIFMSWLFASSIDLSTITSYDQIYNAIANKMNDPLMFYGVLGISVITIISRLISGIFANYWYYKKVTKEVNQIMSEPMENVTRDELLMRKGGTSMMYALLAYIAANSGVSLLMTLIM